MRVFGYHKVRTPRRRFFFFDGACISGSRSGTLSKVLLKSALIGYNKGERLTHNSEDSSLENERACVENGRGADGRIRDRHELIDDDDELLGDTSRHGLEAAQGDENDSNVEPGGVEDGKLGDGTARVETLSRLIMAR